MSGSKERKIRWEAKMALMFGVGVLALGCCGLASLGVCNHEMGANRYVPGQNMCLGGVGEVNWGLHIGALGRGNGVELIVVDRTAKKGVGMWHLVVGFTWESGFYKE